MFEVGQLVFVKSISYRVYLGMIMDTVLNLNNYEDSFYTVYLIESADQVTVPSQFITPGSPQEDVELRHVLFGTGSSDFKK